MQNSQTQFCFSEKQSDFAITIHNFRQLHIQMFDGVMDPELSAIDTWVPANFSFDIMGQGWHKHAFTWMQDHPVKVL